MKKTILLLLLSLFFLSGCNSKGEDTYSGLYTDKNGSRYVFKQFRIKYYLEDVCFHSKEHTIELCMSGAEELFVVRDPSASVKKQVEEEFDPSNLQDIKYKK